MFFCFWLSFMFYRLVFSFGLRVEFGFYWVGFIGLVGVLFLLNRLF